MGLQRAACERRVYRLACLLTGDPAASARVIEAVLDAQPDLRGLDSAHMDRLTVLRSRDVRARPLVDERIPPDAARAVAALPAQQREAWVFRRVYGIDGREAARATDCSRTALERHVELAEAALAVAGGGSPQHLAQSLLAASLALDVPPFYHARRRRRRRMRWILRGLVALVIATILVGAVLAWREWAAPIPTPPPSPATAPPSSGSPS